MIGENCPVAATLDLIGGKYKALILWHLADKKLRFSELRARVSGATANMLTAEQVVELIGHAVGGVCPFAVNGGVEVYLDESLKRFGTVFPAAGSSNSAIELTIEELEKYSGFTAWVDVCKGWQEA